MGAVMTRNSEMFSSLLSDTEEHFRQHRDSISPRAENRSVGVHLKPEVSVSANSSSSSDGSYDDRGASTAEFGQRSEDKPEKPKEDLHVFQSNAQTLMQQDQCCPGFTMTKGGKARHQNNGCSIV